MRTESMHDTGIDLIVIAIAATGGRCQPFPVEDSHLSAVIFNEPPFLEGNGGGRDADSTYAEHIGQKFVRYPKCVAMRPILHHQEPATQACIDFMKARTRS